MKGRWPRGRADVSEPGGPGFDSSSRQPQVVAHQHWARWITAWYSLVGAVLCLASNHGIACARRLGPTQPVIPTSGDDKWVAAKHCGWAKRSRISDTHRLRSSLQLRYINNQPLLFKTFSIIFHNRRFLLHVNKLIEHSHHHMEHKCFHFDIL